MSALSLSSSSLPNLGIIVLSIENMKSGIEWFLHGKTRADLFSFAIAIAKMEDKEPTDIQTVNSFVRTEYLGNYEALLSALYYEDNLKDNTDQIDDICNRDEVYALAEKYANTGFGILKDWNEHLDEETLFYKLIGWMDNLYQEIKDEVSSLV